MAYSFDDATIYFAPSMHIEDGLAIDGVDGHRAFHNIPPAIDVVSFGDYVRHNWTAFFDRQIGEGNQHATSADRLQITRSYYERGSYENHWAPVAMVNSQQMSIVRQEDGRRTPSERKWL
jgi:hypothetical protein